MNPFTRARTCQDIGCLLNPFVRNPLGSKNDWAASVEHGHITGSTFLNVVPENGTSPLRFNGYSEAGKRSISSHYDLKKSKFHISDSHQIL